MREKILLQAALMIVTMGAYLLTLMKASLLRNKQLITIKS
jgi:hypothetical protein